MSRSQIKLVAEQLSTNAQEPSEGPIKNAVDGDKNTFFHTNWHEAIPYPQWIQVNLKEPHENFLVGYINRTDNSWTTSGRPSVVHWTDSLVQPEVNIFLLSLCQVRLLLIFVLV